MWNPPALTATEEGQDVDSVTTKPIGADDGGGLSHGANSFGADTMFSPFASLGFADVPLCDVQRDRRSYPPECKNEKNTLCLDLNCSTDPMTGANLFDVKNDKCELNRESDTRELCDVTDRKNTFLADCSMNFMPPCYPVKAHGAEAKNSRIRRSPVSSSERSASVFPLVDNFGVTGNINNNDINIVPPPYSSPQNVNGNFLSLGIGGGTEIKSNSDFSTREIASKLGDPVSNSSQYKSSIVGQSPTNHWNFTPFTGLAAGVQTNGGGLSRLALSGSSRLNPIQFPGLETPQANPQPSFSATYDNFVFDQTPSSSPSGVAIIPHRGHVTQSPLGPQIPRPTCFASPVIPRQQQYIRRSSINASSESSRNYLSDRHGGSSISHAQLGTLTPVKEARRTQIVAGVRFPGTVQPVGNFTSQVESTSTRVTNIGPSPSSVQPVVHSSTSHNLGSVAALGNSLFPGSFGFPISRASTIQSAAAAGPFPRRLGVQPNEPTVRTIGGTPAIRLPAQAYPVRPIVSSGQHHHGLPAQLPMDFPRADYSSGIHSPAQAYPVRPLVSSGQVTPIARFGVSPQGSFVSHPYLKRQATENPSTALVSQRRKISRQPVVIHHSAPRQRQSFPAPIPSTCHIPPAPLHIKWQGFDEPLEPSGHKCLLCKRDISFTAEGQVYQPAIPPATAVLPCGHTFHDDCLQRITPADYSKKPPCIPCALGET